MDAPEFFQNFRGVIKHFDFFLPPICKFARLGIILIEKMPVYNVSYVGFFYDRDECVEQVCQLRVKCWTIEGDTLVLIFTPYTLNLIFNVGCGWVDLLDHTLIAHAIPLGRNPWNAMGVVAPPEYFCQQTTRV